MRAFSKTTSARALNRLIVACREDMSVLDAAARTVADPLAKERLSSQSDVRGVFVRDLETAVRAAGGIPAKHRSLHATATAVVGRLRTFVGGKHEGDAYARCADVEAKTEAAYVAALETGLQPDEQFGVAQQYAEIKVDCKELKWMRGLC